MKLTKNEYLLYTFKFSLSFLKDFSSCNLNLNFAGNESPITCEELGDECLKKERIMV